MQAHKYNFIQPSWPIALVLGSGSSELPHIGIRILSINWDEPILYKKKDKIVQQNMKRNELERIQIPHIQWGAELSCPFI